MSARTWIGRIVLASPFSFSPSTASSKLLRIGPVLDSFNELGYPQNLALAIGLIDVFCLLVLLIPRTSMLGAVLLTGYLGGAVATHASHRRPARQPRPLSRLYRDSDLGRHGATSIRAS